MRIGIRPQAVLLAGVPLVALVFVLTLASLISEHTEQAGRFAGRIDDALAQSTQLLDTLTGANRSVLRYARSKNSSDLAAFAAAAGRLAEQQRRLRRSVADQPQLANRAAAYARSINRGLDIVSAYEAAVRAGNAGAMRRIIASPATRQVSDDLQRTRSDFDNAVRDQASRSRAERRAQQQSLEQTLLAGVLAGIFSTILVSLLFGMNIVRRLGVLGENARRLAEGTPALPVGGNDEISELDSLYRMMADRIQTSARAHEAALEELERERSVAALLQQTLLPEIPAIAGLHIDSAYVTPAEGTQIGGDWFDVFPLSERYVGLSVGDVTGHGLRAVASMGFIRQAIRVVARIDTNPAAVMERVNRIVCDEKASIASAFFGVYDRESGTLGYALAGHGPPLVASAAGTTALLEGGGMLLGLDANVRYAQEERRLRPGDALVLYTDGILEAERDYLKGMRDLQRAVRAELRQRSPNLAEGIQQRVFSEASPRDDSALLVLEVVHLTASAEPENTVWQFDARDQNAAWRVKRELLVELRALGELKPDLDVAELVYAELISNVVRHTPGSARIYLSIESGHVVLNVEDEGPPLHGAGRFAAGAHPPDVNAENGRGLFIIKSLCRQMTVESLRHGKRTRVALPPADDHEDAAAGERLRHLA